MTKQVDVLIYVEDPGAVNYIASLPRVLMDGGINCHVAAGGHATACLEGYHCSFTVVHNRDSAEDLLGRFAPKAIMVGTSENRTSLGLALIDAAKAKGVPSFGVVDALVNYEMRFRGLSGAPLTHAPDILLVPDNATCDAFRSLGMSADRVLICGHPHYDAVRMAGRKIREIGRSELRANVFGGTLADRPAIIFAAELSDGLDPGQFRKSDAYSFSGRGINQGRTEIVLEEFLDAVAQVKEEPFLVLRLAPKNLPSDYAEYQEHFDLISHGGNPYKLLCSVDLVVGMTTCLLLDAYLLGIPTLSILPRSEERNWLASTRVGVSPVVYTRRDIMPAMEKCLARGLKPIVDEDPFFPGGAAERITDILKKYVLGN